MQIKDNQITFVPCELRTQLYAMGTFLSLLQTVRLTQVGLGAVLAGWTWYSSLRYQTASQCFGILAHQDLHVSPGCSGGEAVRMAKPISSTLVNTISAIAQKKTLGMGIAISWKTSLMPFSGIIILKALNISLLWKHSISFHQ